MNSDRRSFFKSLAMMAGAASVSPLIFIPKFEPVKWKVTRLEQSSILTRDDILYLGPEGIMPFEPRVLSGPWMFFHGHAVRAPDAILDDKGCYLQGLGNTIRNPE